MNKNINDITKVLALFLMLYPTNFVAAQNKPADKKPKKEKITSIDTLDYRRVDFSETKFPKRIDINVLYLDGAWGLRGRLNCSKYDSVSLRNAKMYDVRKIILGAHQTPESVGLSKDFPADKIKTIDYIVRDVDGIKHNFFEVTNDLFFLEIDLYNMSLFNLELCPGLMVDYFRMEDVRNIPKKLDFSNMLSVYITRCDLLHVNEIIFPKEEFIVSGVQLPRVIDLSNAKCKVDLSTNGWAFVKKVILPSHLTPEDVGVPDFFDRRKIVQIKDVNAINANLTKPVKTK